MKTTLYKLLPDGNKEILVEFPKAMNKLSKKQQAKLESFLPKIDEK